ncbi:MAG TPA: glycosyltransferase family 39 protein [Elusimicrobiota bacterium]|nr:glycosyltransferase family 39 protein [Elusimicrobiota bacterium]
MLPVVRISGWLERLLLAALLTVYGFIQIRGLLIPGLNGDEASGGVWTQKIIRLGWQGFKQWPLGGSYHAALQSYLYVPFFLLIKTPLLALRIGELFFSSVVIALAYLCARRFFGVLAALFMLVFLLFNPVFIYMSRISTPHGGVMAAFWLGALLFLDSWHKTSKDRWLFAAAFLTGAGFCVYIWFYWFIFGLLFSTLAVYSREIMALFFRPVRWRRIAGGGVSFLFGLTPYILKEIYGHYENLFRLAIASLHHGIWGSVNNFEILSNWGVSLWQFLGTLAGGMWDILPYYSLVHDGFISFMMIYCGFLLASSAAILLFWKPSRGTRRRRDLFLVALLGGMLLPSCLTLSTFRQLHLYLIFPLPQMIMGAAAAALFDRSWAARPRAKTLCLALLLFIASPFLYLREYSSVESFLRMTGGTGTVSDSIETIANWLEKHGYFTPVACDWGLAVPLQLLSNGRITPLSLWPDLNAGDRGFFRHPGGDNVYLLYAAHGNLPFASAALTRQGLAFHVLKTFYTKNGEPNAVACAVIKRGRANLPQNQKHRSELMNLP